MLMFNVKKFYKGWTFKWDLNTSNVNVQRKTTMAVHVIDLNLNTSNVNVQQSKKERDISLYPNLNTSNVNVQLDD